MKKIWLIIIATIFLINFVSADYNLSVNLISPSALYFTNDLAPTIYFYSNATVTSGNLTNATLYVWGSANVTNFTTVLLQNNFTNLSRKLGDGTYSWNVLYCSTNILNVICGFADANRTVDISRRLIIDYTTGTTYKTMEESSAGLAVFINTFSPALLFLMIFFVIIIVVLKILVDIKVGIIKGMRR